MKNSVTAGNTQFPPAASQKYDPAQDLLGWMSQGFDRLGDIYQASIYGTNSYLTRDPAHAQHVLIDRWQNYVKGQFIKRVAFLLGNGLMVSEGEFWKAQRRLIQPAFHRDVIATFVKPIVLANLELVKKWEAAAIRAETVNVTHDISLLILKVILLVIFGSDYQDVAAEFAMVSDHTARNPEFARAFRGLGTFVARVIECRRKTTGRSADLLDIMMRTRDPQGHPIPDGQLIKEVLTIIVAGHETTASSLNWLWYLISQHPDVEERLSIELHSFVKETELEGDDLSRFMYTRQVIEETLRLYPPGWLLTRRALSDDFLGSYFVPAGTEIYIPPYFIQRNPALWERPSEFDPDRFNQDRRQIHRLAMLPFSAGPRNCIGEYLARIEMQIHVMIVAKQLHLNYIQTTPIELEAGVNLRSKYDFIMHPVLRQVVDE